MGAIYAAAHFTIVAAAGNGSDHGLPGTPSHVRRFLRHESIGSVCLSILPSLKSMLPIIGSTWASRAWTFQEGILSKRCVVFTDQQVTFICKEGEQPEIGKIHTQSYFMDAVYRRGLFTDRTNDEEQDPVEQALHYLEGYSSRRLSYETDALNAIVGALRSLKNKSIYNIWGVPLRPKPLTNAPNIQSGYGLALGWEHTRSYSTQVPIRRRCGFPSWSSVGWSGAIRYVGAHLYDTNAIWIQVADNRVQLSAFDSVLQDSTDISPRIEIKGRTTDVRRLVPCSDAVRIAIPLPSGTNIVLTPSWDIEDAELENFRHIKGLLLLRTGSYMEDSPSRIMLLRPCGQCYERIGVVQVPYFGNEFSIKPGQSMIPGHAAFDYGEGYPFTLRDKNLGPYSSKERSKIRSDFFNQYGDNPFFWVQEFFSPETILLE